MIRLVQQIQKPVSCEFPLPQTTLRSCSVSSLPVSSMKTFNSSPIVEEWSTWCDLGVREGDFGVWGFFLEVCGSDFGAWRFCLGVWGRNLGFWGCDEDSVVVGCLWWIRELKRLRGPVGLCRLMIEEMVEVGCATVVGGVGVLRCSEVEESE